MTAMLTVSPTTTKSLASLQASYGFTGTVCTGPIPSLLTHLSTQKSYCVHTILFIYMYCTHLRNNT